MAYLDQGRLGLVEPIDQLLGRHRLLTWAKDGQPPPQGLGWVQLPAEWGQRALATQWDEALARPWLGAGGEATPADLETLFLNLSGELGHG